MAFPKGIAYQSAGEWNCKSSLVCCQSNANTPSGLTRHLTILHTSFDNCLPCSPQYAGQHEKQRQRQLEGRHVPPPTPYAPLSILKQCLPFAAPHRPHLLRIPTPTPTSCATAPTRARTPRSPQHAGQHEQQGQRQLEDRHHWDTGQGRAGHQGVRHVGWDTHPC